MWLHFSQIQLGPHQTNHGAQRRQEAHSPSPQKRSENDTGQHGGSHQHRRWDGQSRQSSERRATQATPDHASAQAASAEIASQS